MKYANSNLKEQLMRRIDYLSAYKEIGVRFDTETPNSGGWCQCFAIDRDEQKPSAAVNLQNGFYTDLGSGQRLDFFQMMQMYGGFTSFWETLKSFAEKYNIEVPKGRPTHSPEADVTFQRWSPIGDRWCAIKSTSADAVHLFGGSLCRYKSAYYCVGFKVFSDPMATDDPAGYVVAQTDGHPIPVYNRNGEITGECKIKTVSGTASGLLGEHALSVIRTARESGDLSGIKVVFKVEGVTDALALQARIPVDLRRAVLVVTNSAGCAERPKEEYKDAFDGLPVVLIHDQDEPGQKGLSGWKSFLAGRASSLKVVNLPFPMTKTHGKDLKDFFTEGHTFHELMELVKAAEPITAEAASAETESPEYDDDPHRIVREFLERKYKIPEAEGVYTLVNMEGDFYFYTEGRYQIVSAMEIKAVLVQFVKDLFHEDYQRHYDSWQNAGSGREPKQMKVTNAIIANALTVLSSELYEKRRPGAFIRYGEIPFDLEKNYILAFRNGIWFHQAYYDEVHRPKRAEMENYFLPASPQIFNTRAFDYDYDPNAFCQEWERMNRENLMMTTPEGGLSFAKYSVIQEFMGYALMPTNKLQSFLLLSGDGANGKSALLTGLEAAFGQANISNISLESFNERFSIANFYGKMLNIVDDLSEVDRTSEGKLKSIVSGSQISADRKNREILTFNPELKLIFACNVEPRFRDTTSGIWRRMIKIQFDRIIPEKDRRPEFCTPEYWMPHRAAIMNWCIRGMLQLMENGMKFTYCQSIEDAKLQYQMDLNPVLQFFQEYLVEESGASVATGSVYHIYTIWCSQNGFKQFNSANFAKELYRQFKSVSRERRRTNYTRVYHFKNLKFNPEADIPRDI